VSEGATAAFTVEVNPAPTTDLSVQLTVTESSGVGQDFVAPGDEGANKTVVIPAGQTSVIYNVSTVADATDEPDGVVTVTVRDPAAREYNTGESASVSVSVTDNDATVASLTRVGSGDVVEGEKVAFTVTLGRPLVADEIIDVPLAVEGSGVSTSDWSLSTTTGAGLNTGVSLSGASTATPAVRFSGAGAQTATLAWTPLADGVAESTETVTIELGPDGGGANGFDRTPLGTTVGGGANPHGTQHSFSVAVADLPDTSKDDDTPQVSITMGPSCLTPSSWSGWRWLRGVSTGTTNRQKVQALAVRAVRTLEGGDTLTWTEVRTQMTGQRWVEGPTDNWQALRIELNRLEGCRSEWQAVSEGTAASFTLTASPAPTAPLPVVV